MPVCLNCKSPQVKGRYSPDQWRCAWRIFVGGVCYGHPHTHWKCNTCGYTWITA